jgi:MFS transporter, SP family, solute carrier family 2 (facilitated glucose transporter), member 1
VTWLSYLAVAAVILFVVGFATGPGSIPWFFVTELFAQSGRPIATSIAVAVNWSANFLVGLGFSPIQVGALYCTLVHDYVLLRYKSARKVQ